MNLHIRRLIALVLFCSAGAMVSACEDTETEPTFDAVSSPDAMNDTRAPRPDGSRPEDGASLPDDESMADTLQPPSPDVANDSSIPETTSVPDSAGSEAHSPSPPDAVDDTSGAEGPTEQDATTADTSAPSVVLGETCQQAPSLLELSGPPSDDPPYYRTATGAFGNSDDYNPLETSGLPPACALVYDAYGSEVVVTLTLSPGETLNVVYGITPASQPGGIYLLDSCDSLGWPDIDGSGKCGNNEYASQGFCSLGSCNGLEFSFTWPLELDGEATSEKTFWLVLDQVAGDAGTDWSLDWAITAAP